MKSNALGAAMFKAIVEFLVVAEVEALLLKFPFKVPVCFSDEQEPRVRRLDGGDHISPILSRWPGSAARCPCTLEDIVNEQHCHVATNAIALASDGGNRLNSRSSQFRVASI